MFVFNQNTSYVYPVAYWRFDGSDYARFVGGTKTIANASLSGNFTHDMSGTCINMENDNWSLGTWGAFDGGGLKLIPSRLPASGSDRYMMHFDWVDERIRCVADDSLRFSKTDSWSVSFWCHNQIISNNDIISFWDGVTGARLGGWGVKLSSGKPAIMVGDSAGNLMQVTASTQIGSSDPYHWVVVYSGSANGDATTACSGTHSSIKFYKDGKQERVEYYDVGSSSVGGVTNNAVAATSNATAPSGTVTNETGSGCLGIGGAALDVHYLGSRQLLSGGLSNLAVWNFALNAGQVDKLFNGGYHMDCNFALTGANYQKNIYNEKPLHPVVFDQPVTFAETTLRVFKSEAGGSGPTSLQTEYSFNASPLAASPNATELRAGYYWLDQGGAAIALLQTGSTPGAGDANALIFVAGGLFRIHEDGSLQNLF
jgi:hypothetical protein